ncbi:hypothetical protein DM02DRAFT_79809 [Periconia macrospinosa]|uniref:BTB domain-containing protein n=1 Tax=Periconia macrospinosa TaxID=97972 RepID=A0A2V1CY91_9PLEO|nr:hypothetical protein DM02DRAFT_79809 [Periconia macrospinosa]
MQKSASYICTALSEYIYSQHRFQNAVTTGFKENIDKEVTLEDSPEFADAIDCMVSYFYNANYDTSKYNASESLLHAQVAIIADEYDCASLYRLAKISFANAIKAVESDDWAAIAPLIYDYTTTELQAHKELRGLVVAAVTDNTILSKSIFQMKSIEELLRSNADLATDLLLSGQQRLRDKEASTSILTCNNTRRLGLFRRQK